MSLASLIAKRMLNRRAGPATAKAAPKPPPSAVREVDRRSYPRTDAGTRVAAYVPQEWLSHLGTLLEDAE